MYFIQNYMQLMILCGAHFQFGDSQKLRLVRILRSTVMVRVGGGWIALDEFLVKNDPCRGKLTSATCYMHIIMLLQIDIIVVCSHEITSLVVLFFYLQLVSIFNFLITFSIHNLLKCHFLTILSCSLHSDVLIEVSIFNVLVNVLVLASQFKILVLIFQLKISILKIAG